MSRMFKLFIGFVVHSSRYILYDIYINVDCQSQRYISIYAKKRERELVSKVTPVSSLILNGGTSI